MKKGDADGLPHAFEAALALGALGVLAPLMAGAAIAVRVSSPGPVLFRQIRIGRHGVPFTMLKFRTMRVVKPEEGTKVTASGDNRITPIGRVLRKTKLDELPELWNVVRGEMALVGPRPEVPAYVDMNDPAWRHVLSVRPGITDPVTLKLRNEEELLAQAGGNVDDFYRGTLLPYKLAEYRTYFERRSWFFDVATLAKTAFAIMLPHKVNPPTLSELRGARGVAAVADSATRPNGPHMANASTRELNQEEHHARRNV